MLQILEITKSNFNDNIDSPPKTVWDILSCLINFRINKDCEKVFDFIICDNEGFLFRKLSRLMVQFIEKFVTMDNKDTCLVTIKQCF